MGCRDVDRGRIRDSGSMAGTLSHIAEPRWHVINDNMPSRFGEVT